MKNFLCLKKVFSQKTSALLLLAFSLLIALFCVGCKKEIDYLDYVSELRSNILLAEKDGFSLRVYAVKKETPYICNGIPAEISDRAEIYLTAPASDKEYLLSFTVDGKNYGGDLSFDNVKTEYYYACALDLSQAQEIPFTIRYGENELTLTATSVRTEKTLAPKNVLQTLTTEENALFESLTDEYGFAGEIYLRLIYEDFPYYYVGVIDRNGQTNAFLINGETGKIIAKRRP